MAAQLRLVMHTAQGHALELASRCARDALAKRGLAHAGRTDKAQDRALARWIELAHGKILEDALLDLFKAVMVRVEDLTRGTLLATHCAIARNFITRGVGLLGRSHLAEGDGLLITKTSLITMLFMRFAIDAVFVDKQLRVVKVVHELRPWVVMSGAPGADAVLELPAGAAARAGAQAGDVLRLA